MVVDHPVVLREDRVVVDVELGASDRQPVLDVAFAPGTKTGIRYPCESKMGLPAASVA